MTTAHAWVERVVPNALTRLRHAPTNARLREAPEPKRVEDNTLHRAERLDGPQ